MSRSIEMELVRIAGAVVLGGVFTLGLSVATPGQAWAQTEEGIEPEQEGDEGFEANVDNPASNQTDAMRDRPTGTSNIMRPYVSGELIDGERKMSTDALRWTLGVNTRFIRRDNLDFRATDEASPQSIIDSDDNVTFAATQLRATFAYSAVENITINAGFGHNGLWGGDSVGDIEDENMLFVDLVNVDWTIVDTDAVTLSTRVGRQFLSIGGVRKDYLFWDVVDGVSLNLDLKKAGRIRGFGDIVGVQLRPDEVDFNKRPDRQSAGVNFRGDNFTVRTGLIYENDTIIDGLDMRAFAFYADIGASDPRGTGADVTYGGVLGNFADNDYSSMFGARVGYTLDMDTIKLRLFGEYARSAGLDRKDTSVGYFDVLTDGNAFGGGLDGQLKLGGVELGLLGRFFRADGSQYEGQQGLRFNHGFVGFKGAHAGGTLMDDQAGLHPTSYIGSTRGVENTPQSQSRKAGTQVIEALLSVGFNEAWQLQAGAWVFQDAGFTLLAEDDIAVAAQDLPFGWTQADLEAQQRLGSYMGTEIDVGFSYSPQDVLAIFAQGAVFLPGDYFAREITRAGGTALGSSTPQMPWAVSTGMSFYWE